MILEDSVVGITAAKSAGMKCVAIINTYSAEDLKNADMQIKSYKDISVEKIKELGK